MPPFPRSRSCRGRESKIYSMTSPTKEKDRQEKTLPSFTYKIYTELRGCSQKDEPIKLLRLICRNNSPKIFLATVLHNREFIVRSRGTHAQAARNVKIQLYPNIGSVARYKNKHDDCSSFVKFTCLFLIYSCRI